jgi:tryptophan synthase alpha chain
MTRLTKRLEALKALGEKALICYVVAGDPSPVKTVEIVRALDDAGADAVELGIPFSDPLADGPSIQSASYRALNRGISVSGVFEILRGIREVSQIPVVLMTYFNPALRYGLERFAQDAAGAGADGVIQTDLTPEEAGPWIEAAKSAGLDTVFLLAPTSTADRIEVVARLASGFVYCVSRTGVTGARDEVPAELRAFIGRVREGFAAEGRNLPVCVGFGVSRPEHVARIGAFADGVVVGSALVDLIANNADRVELCEEVKRFATGLKAATLPA